MEVLFCGVGRRGWTRTGELAGRYEGTRVKTQLARRRVDKFLKVKVESHRYPVV